MSRDYQVGSKIKISSKNLDRLYNSLLDMTLALPRLPGRFPNNTFTASDAPDLNTLLSFWQYEPVYKNGNIINLTFINQIFSIDDYRFFIIIAPFVVDNNYLDFEDVELERIRYRFSKGRVYIHKLKRVYIYAPNNKCKNLQEILDKIDKWNK